MENTKRLRAPARASVMYMLSGIIGKGIGILSTPVFTRLLSGEDYGIFSLYMSVLGILSLFCSAVHSGSIVYSGLSECESPAGYLYSLLQANFGFCAILCILLFTFGDFLGFTPLLCLLLSLQLFCDCAVGVFLSGKRYSYSYLFIFAVNMFLSLSSPIIAILLIKGFGAGYISRVFSLLFPSLILGASFTLYLFKSSAGKKAPSGQRRGIFKSALPSLPAAAGSALGAQSDKIIISKSLGPTALAKYSVASSLGTGAYFIINAICSALNPWIVRKIRVGEGERVAEIADVGMKVISLLTLFLIAVSPESMRFLAPESYLEAWVAVIPIALSTLPFFVFSVSSSILITLKHSTVSAASSILSLIPSIGGGILLVPRFGFLGIGAALLLGSLTSATAALLFLKKFSDIRFFSEREFVLLFISVLAYALILALFYNYAYLRILLLIPPAVFLLNNIFSVQRLIREI